MIKRFHTNIFKTKEGCWEWIGTTDPRGYGKFKFLGENLAHRVSYIIYKGEINSGSSVRRYCNNPSCVRPEHLFLEKIGKVNKLDLKKVEVKFYKSIVKLEVGCWEWQSFRNDQGYGNFKVLGETLAHRVSYILHRGKIPENICVLHRCDNPSCVNPDHLFLGTWADNNKDRHKKGRTVIYNSLKTHCKRGHEFNERNTYYRKSGNRLCRACARGDK
jgi:hypothetical protein